MKFGESFAQRSVPEWAAFNLNYNGMKNVIKTRTSSNMGAPVDIPQQGKSRWEESDRALFGLFKDQYDNISLFLRMKQGEIDRRLNTIKRQIAALRSYADEKPLEIDVSAAIQGRKFRKLSKEIEELSDLIQKVARFTSAQKIAFRKLLKKYTKWTSSTALQTRMDVEVFSSNQLKTDYSDYLQELAELKTILTEVLATPMLRRQQVEQMAKQQQRQRLDSTSGTRPLIAQITNSIKQTPSAFDAAIMTVPYGEAAGSAMYWIHPENLDEARALLHRYMKRDGLAPSPSQTSFLEQPPKSRGSVSSSSSSNPSTHMIFFDNVQRFARDQSLARPSRVALSAYWNCDQDAAVTLAGLSPSSSGEQTVILDREDLPLALNRDFNLKNYSKNTTTVQKYLAEHRDVKPLAQVRSDRARYIGMSNTADVANWATLDTSVTVDAVDMQQFGTLQQPSPSSTAFPYAILHVRWEFTRMPAVVRDLDELHLAFRVHEFTVEDMAIRTVYKDLPQASWQPLLQTDITKMPITNPYTNNLNRLKTTARMRISSADISGTSSGPSSSEGQSDSVFSTATLGQLSVTSEETRAVGETSAGDSNAVSKKKGKKRARIVVPEPEPRFRYWNEFDDGDSDVNPQDSYAIYVDPDAPAFPGLSKAWGMVKSWWPYKPHGADAQFGYERDPLMFDEETASIESSDSDSFAIAQQQELRRGLVWGLVGGASITFVLVIAILAFCMISLG